MILCSNFICREKFINFSKKKKLKNFKNLRNVRCKIFLFGMIWFY